MEPTQRPKQARKERRPRTIQACNFCRTKKYKCDGSLPCANCKRLNQNCTFSSAPETGTANISIAYVKQLERRLEAAEAQLKQYEHLGSAQTTASATAVSSASSSRMKSPVSTPDRSAGERASLPPRPPAATLESLPEVMDVNVATKRFEFHGTSSIITALDRLVQLRSDIITKSPTSDITLAARSISAVTEFQNDSFMLKAHKPLLLSMSFSDDEYFSLYAPVFLDAYFTGLHYIYPLIDQGFFLKRCSDMWRGDTSRLRASFRLQYYGVLALGAATRSWRDGPINGLNQVEWTQMFISKAEQTMTEVEYQTDFEGAQAMFLLAQVHLQFLSYNTAHTYLGNAIRIAHAGACHRQMKQEDSKVPVDSPTSIISRVWWSLYSQEIELSFLLGRPDSLGDETCFTRQLPPVSQGSEINIIPAMHGISKAMRDISTHLYHGNGDLPFMLSKASTIDANLDRALLQASSYIQGFNDTQVQNQASVLAGDRFWVQWQLCLLRIRYLHAKVALFYPFFLHVDQAKEFSADEPFVALAASNCLEASCQLIREVFRGYKTQNLQRTWSYYSAYMLRALAVVLTSLTRTAGISHQTSKDRDAVIQALHVLDSLDNNDVPRRIANFTREYLTLLAKSGRISSLAPLKNRYHGPPSPSEHSNHDDYLQIPSHFPFGNFDAHIPSDQSHFQSFSGASYTDATENSFVLVDNHSLGQMPQFIVPDVHFHGGPT
ncbi:uncharacterized protein PV09_01915 [Verruconis gallopava]|uniref:Zn(2)-C6 fungal-type domain-containing protein n=1 Tax=Verruconis gallopava TaxID=253628 RepID=A0A0D1XWC3_9PEZI|nr:uncharacterized protein PV09_01915 [Verruconis gallopava]KIW07021.1 hypothetical protein PV09_01915 [Verruconis gallopava]